MLFFSLVFCTALVNHQTSEVIPFVLLSLVESYFTTSFCEKKLGATHSE